MDYLDSLEAKIERLKSEYQIYSNLNMWRGQIWRNGTKEYRIAADSPKGKTLALTVERIPRGYARKWINKAVIACDMVKYDCKGNFIW